MSEDATVSGAEIARLAGVGRAAVSNWRRRHDDFPLPVGGTETSPAFRLKDIQAWLSDHGKLGSVSVVEKAWRLIESGVPELVADRLVKAGAYLVRGSRSSEIKPILDALRTLAEAEGPESAFDQLCDRFIAATSRGTSIIPRELARLMVRLAAPGVGTVFDPACGFGATLRAAAVAAPAVRLAGQELDSTRARIARSVLGFGGSHAVINDGDALRSDAFADLEADVVLCVPPFNVRNWGAEDLTYDPRWAFGMPAKGESELAWVQHCLAHTRAGGRVIIVLPPAVASRRTGRAIRAQLIRSGVLRAVMALPAGTATPLGLPLHLWIMTKPAETSAHRSVLFVDTAAGASGRVEEVGWSVVNERASATWMAFERDGSAGTIAGECKTVPAIELLDDDVDLTPARHVRGAMVVDVADLSRARESLAAMLGELPALLPRITATASGQRAVTSIGEFQRSGALTVQQQALRFDVRSDGRGMPVLTVRDVVAGRGPSGWVDEIDGLVTVTTGDVVVPVMASRPTAMVVPEGEWVLGPNLTRIRAVEDGIDPWFLAGFLRSQESLRFASTLAGTHRVDVRKVELPRIPPVDQRRYGTAFRQLAEFDRTLRQASVLGRDFIDSLIDGTAAGALGPAD